jgi:cytochrome c-type biogenesis protein CcmH
MGDPMLFWTVAALLALAVGGMLALALLRARDQRAPPAASDVAVYRDQLKEVERDLARGLIAEDEADRLRTEVSRRLLDADRTAHTGAAPAAAPPAAGAATATAAAADTPHFSCSSFES